MDKAASEGDACLADKMAAATRGKLTSINIHHQ